MEHSRKSTDMRCIKTKKAIKKALASLMTERDVSQITVKSISELALINRKTFYAHYSSVYDILEEIENEMIANLSEINGSIDFSTGKFDSCSTLKKLTALIYADFDFYKYLLQSRTYNSLLNKVKEVWKERSMEVLIPNIKLPRNKLDSALEFIAAGTISVYQQWFNSDRSQTLEEISETVSTIAFRGVNALMEEK